MTQTRNIIYLLITTLFLACSAPGLDAYSATRKAKTTSVSKKKKTTGRRRSTKSSKNSKSSKTRRSGNAKRGWQPFGSFETKATPAPFYLPTDSLHSLTRKAGEGNSEALYLLGCAHFEKNIPNVSPDSADIIAARYWQQAAAQGHPTAMGNLAYCFRTGRGVAADTVKAVGLYVGSLLGGNPRLEALTRRNAARGSQLDAFILTQAIEHGLDASDNRDIDYFNGISSNLATNKTNVPETIEIDEYQLALERLNSKKEADDEDIVLLTNLLQNNDNSDIIDAFMKLVDDENPGALLVYGLNALAQDDVDAAYQAFRNAALNGSDKAIEELVAILTNEKDRSFYDPFEAYLWLDLLCESDIEALSATADALVGEPSATGFIKAMAALNSGKSPDFASAAELFAQSDVHGSNMLQMMCHGKASGDATTENKLQRLAVSRAPGAAVAYFYYDPKLALPYLQVAAEKGDLMARTYLAAALFDRKKYREASQILSEIKEGAILSRRGAEMLSICDSKTK
ncbi:MAG: sel1 repeat family protein [Muribaculaceae bacterium]|nr:sel1 repeat family protein [Muribaculaceae bacterium]